MRLERLLSAPVLIVVNAAIVVAALTVGNGEFFHESGLIHAIAILFIVLAATRIFTRFYLFDPELRILLKASLLAMAVFALSHLVEFASFSLEHGYTDGAFANVINMYLISLFMMLLGANTVILHYEKKAHWSRYGIFAAMLAFALLTVLILTGKVHVSLEPDRPEPYLYAALVVFATAATYRRWSRVKRMYAWFMPFIDRVMLGAVMIALAALPNVFYEHLEHLGFEEIHSIYLSHFTFYAALSVMYLAYDRVQDLGGLHKDLREEIRKEERAA